MTSPIIDLFLVYQFIKRLITPFKDWDAYKLGIIDEKGKVLKKRVTLSSHEQKRAWGYFDIVAANLKKLLAKIPGGQSRLAAFVAAGLMLREQYRANELTEDDIEIILKEELVNVVGDGNIEFPGNTPLGNPKKDDPTVLKRKKLIIKSFKNKINEDLRQWFDPKHPKGGWKRINSKGDIVGPCAKEKGESKPKCMSNEKIASLSKKQRASAVKLKRKYDPNPERKGTPINVSNYGKGKISEEELKYLQEKNVPTNPKLWSKAKSLAKSKFDIYPSAYANGWAAKWYKSKGGGWKSI